MGILVPAAVAVAVGLLKARPWAHKAAYGVLGGFALIGVSVASMAAAMLARNDPDASALVAAFTGFAAVYGAFTVALYRPLFAPRTNDGTHTPETATTTDRVPTR